MSMLPPPMAGLEVQTAIKLNSVVREQGRSYDTVTKVTSYCPEIRVVFRPHTSPAPEPGLRAPQHPCSHRSVSGLHWDKLVGV